MNTANLRVLSQCRFLFIYNFLFYGVSFMGGGVVVVVVVVNIFCFMGGVVNIVKFSIF